MFGTGFGRVIGAWFLLHWQPAPCQGARANTGHVLPICPSPKFSALIGNLPTRSAWHIKFLRDRHNFLSPKQYHMIRSDWPIFSISLIVGPYKVSGIKFHAPIIFPGMEEISMNRGSSDLWNNHYRWNNIIRYISIGNCLEMS